MTITTPLAISAPIALASEHLRAEVDDGQRVARLDRVEQRARGAGVDLLAALALLGREQHAEALVVRVERLLQMADRDLRRDLDEVDDAAPVRQVEERAQVALHQVEVDDADRPSRLRADRGERELERDGRGADAALGAGDGDQPAAERAGGRLLSRDPLAQRARPLRRRAHARLELLERERQRDDVAQPGLHRGAQQLGRVVGRDQHQTRLGERLGELARQVEHRHGAERVVQHDDVDVVTAERARHLLGLVDDRDDLQPFALLRERGGAGRDVAVGDGEQEALAHCAGSGSGSRL